ncbi:molybdopterin converting factor subunit 1 [Bacillus sp. N9]
MEKCGSVINKVRSNMLMESQRRKICMNKLLLFAHLKDEVGSGELSINAAGKNVEELRTYLEVEYSLGSLEGIMVAVNEEFATDDLIIKAGDEIALIPPVSGG